MWPLFARRTVLFPTALGWFLLVAVTVGAALLLSFSAESFLSRSSRLPADILVVEAWTQDDGALAAAAEFRAHPGQYRLIVASGGLTGQRWSRKRWREVEIVMRGLRNDGIPAEVMLGADVPDVETHRTFVTAQITRKTLEAKGERPAAINVLTRGCHARRSRLVFQRVFGPETKVGVIAWVPPGYDSPAWWRSSERAVDLLKEAIGYSYEVVLHSGRLFLPLGPETAGSESAGSVEK